MTDVGVPQRRSLRRLREDGGEDSDQKWWGLVEGDGGGARGERNADFTTNLARGGSFPTDEEPRTRFFHIERDARLPSECRCARLARLARLGSVRATQQGQQQQQQQSANCQRRERKSCAERFWDGGYEKKKRLWKKRRAKLQPPHPSNPPHP